MQERQSDSQTGINERITKPDVDQDSCQGIWGQPVSAI